ncbi:hypothetical protein JWG42_06025, partial [Desulfoprunum benzoelyticum]|uniref:hypothetical protein n=1 Tax=Desulfoprunum benzoelyticum TaxID=1506996 RepID=UPI00196517AC
MGIFCHLDLPRKSPGHLILYGCGGGAVGREGAEGATAALSAGGSSQKDDPRDSAPVELDAGGDGG